MRLIFPCLLVANLAITTNSLAYGVGPAVPLETRAKAADVVCKAVAVANRVVVDPWFGAIGGYEVVETELNVISTLKGRTPKKPLLFHHYASAPGPSGYTPPHVTFVVGRAYLVLAASQPDGTFRILSKDPTDYNDSDTILASDNAPHRGHTITEAAWSELTGLVASTSTSDRIEGIGKLDSMSGGQMTKLLDFERMPVLGTIRSALGSKDVTVATAALDVFGQDTPYYNERDSGYWLAGIGKGNISGLGPRKLPIVGGAELAVTELLATADGTATAEVRALAIRALGRVPSLPLAKVLAWSRDSTVAIRAAGTAISAERAGDRTPIHSGVVDKAPEVRAAAAYAIGFSQDPKLLPLLERLLSDPVANVHKAAAMSILSFSVDQSAPLLKAGLKSDYRSLFVNILAKPNVQPYLGLLAEVIAKDEKPAHWWGGSLPAGNSWKLLFAYVSSSPPAEMTTGKLDSSLDALEKMRWYSSSEPRDLHALYITRGMTARAKTFRDKNLKWLGP